MDAFTAWPIVYAAKRGGTADELKERLQECFTTYGIPESITSDGGPQYTSHVVRDFLHSWGVRHRICSAYNPHSNMRAETGVKSMKRILREAITRGDGLEGERARIAVMEYRNTPLRDLNRSPAQLLFGRHMRDLLQLQEGRWSINKAYMMDREEREIKYTAKILSEGIKWSEHTKDLPLLDRGQDVLIQTQVGTSKGKWNKSGRILERNDKSSYTVRMDGSGRITRRNRRHLRPMTGTSQIRQHVSYKLPLLKREYPRNVLVIECIGLLNLHLPLFFCRRTFASVLEGFK